MRELKIAVLFAAWLAAVPVQAWQSYEEVLAAKLMHPDACRRAQWQDSANFLARFVPWRLSALRAQLPLQGWQPAVDAVLPLVGDRQPAAYGSRVGPLLQARVLLDGDGDGPLRSDALAELTQCIDTLANIEPAFAWLLRGQLALRQLGVGGAATAAHAFTRAASGDASEAVRLEALQNRRRVWERMTSCDHRLASYLIRSDRALTPEGPSAWTPTPDDSDDDFRGTRTGAKGLAELLRWKFAKIPACKASVSRGHLLAGSTERARQVLAAAFGGEASGDADGSAFCDPFDHEGAFNPISRVSQNTGLHALGELLKDATRRDTLQDTALISQVQLVLDRLWQALPAPAQAASGQHRVVVPLAPQRFLREYGCRVEPIAFGYLGTPTSFAVDRRPTVVVSSAVIRHALLSSAERIAPQVEGGNAGITDLAVNLQAGFRMELAFVLAHELAHAYVDGGRSFAVTERVLDCAAAVNLRAAFGADAGMGLFSSLAEAALEPGRQDQWRLWDASTVEAAVDRVQAVQRHLAAPPVPPEDILTKCGVHWARAGNS